MKYKIGQIFTIKNNIEFKKALSRENVVIPKGSRFIVGADSLIHEIENGYLCSPFIQIIKKNDDIKEYDKEGLSEYLYDYLKRKFEIDDMLEMDDYTGKDFMNEIRYALEELGF